MGPKIPQAADFPGSPNSCLSWTIGLVTWFAEESPIQLDDFPIKNCPLPGLMTPEGTPNVGQRSPS